MVALPGSEHTLTGMHAGFAAALLAMLWMGGTCTHWVTMTHFKKISPFFPKVSGLTWRELHKSGAKAKPNHPTPANRAQKHNLFINTECLYFKIPQFLLV